MIYNVETFGNHVIVYHKKVMIVFWGIYSLVYLS